MSDIPPEVIAGILSRSPAKSLLRFRCVSKQWRALIDSPSFINMHVSQSINTNTNNNLVFRDDYFDLFSSPLDSLSTTLGFNELVGFQEFAGLGIEPIGSYNGLLCLCNTNEKLAILNPSTQKYVRLPFARIEFPDKAYVQNISYGFGYGRVNDDYKVVRIVQSYGYRDDEFESKVEIYSLRLNSWKRVRDCPYYLWWKVGFGVFASGVLHWVGSMKPSPRFSENVADLIAGFDVATEEYQLVPQPDNLGKDFELRLGVLRECLCLICNYKSSHSDIWVMKDYGVKESWTKLISVAQPRDFGFFESVTPLVYSKDGRQVLLEIDMKSLVWFDLKKKKFKNVRVRGVPKNLEAIVCLGSLVKISGFGRSDGRKQRAEVDKKHRKKISNKRGSSWCFEQVKGGKKLGVRMLRGHDISITGMSCTTADSCVNRTVRFSH
ncbi:hypothetical protein RJ639_018546 [Escallonia herrerae]|uniref:F-box domain-containing protein n=1 Tax=Escallonia herrerae TaxID=1293975 RepID=A0AA88VA29_9ASTE|nr:hypothetical protein RJ639_018546 [Escallonia herrerae]